MTPYRIKPERIIATSAIVGVILFVILFLLSRQSFLTAALNFGIILTLLSIFWFYLNKFGWRRPPFRWIFEIPDLNGRWVGVLDREAENNPHEFTLEIRQTLTHLKCFTYTKGGTSHSFIADILAENGGKPFTLVYTWIGETTNPIDDQQSGMFYGTTKLRLVAEEEKVPRLTGEYFTNRYPRQTRGIINLTFESETLQNSFQ